MITKNCFEDIMKNLSEVYDNAPSPKALQMYYIVFNNKFESDEDFQKATYKLIEKRVFPTFPKPAEWFENGKDDIEVQTLKIAEDIKTATKKYGAYQNVCFENPVIHKIIQDLFGSWVKACKCEIEEFNNLLKWDLPKVVKRYNREKLKSVPLFLEGISTNQNDLLGKQEELKIVYIGDKNKCLAWNKAYSSKNQGCLQNKYKFEKLGFQQKQIEHKEFLDVEKGMKIIEELKIKKVDKAEYTGEEYTQEQLLKMINRS